MWYCIFVIHFCTWKLSNFIFMWSNFHLFWSAKYLNFGGGSRDIRILSHLIQGIYILRKVKNQVLFFLSSWEPNLSDLMVYFCLFQNAILHSVEARVLKILSWFFSECSFHWLWHFFIYFWLSVWVDICILNFLMSF